MEAHFVEETKDAEGRKDYIGWPIGNAFRYPQPKTIQERISHAQKFRNEFGFPNDLEFVVDSIENSFNVQYAAWPDSAYVIGGGGKLLYRSQLEDEGFRASCFSDQIEALLLDSSLLK